MRKYSDLKCLEIIKDTSTLSAHAHAVGVLDRGLDALEDLSALLHLSVRWCWLRGLAVHLLELLEQSVLVVCLSVKFLQLLSHLLLLMLA